jgi:hypothetical protein
MFSDPLVAVMAMLILCFSGILVMFLFVIRSLVGQRAEMREAFRKQQMFLADLERQFMEMSFVLRNIQAKEEAKDSGSGKKPSFETSLSREDDDLMSMLESSDRPKNPPPTYNDLLLPPSPKARATIDDYDPATDPHLFEDSFSSGEDSSSVSRASPRSGRDRMRPESENAPDRLSLRRDG